MPGSGGTITWGSMEITVAVGETKTVTYESTFVQPDVTYSAWSEALNYASITVTQTDAYHGTVSFTGNAVGEATISAGATVGYETTTTNQLKIAVVDPTQVIVAEKSLQDIADAIREKLGVATTYKPADMASAIASISGGGGGQAVSCGHISSSVVAQVDVEHGLGQRPTIWGLLRESPFGQTMVRYEAIEKVRYYAQSGSSFVIRQADVFASRAGSFNQGYTQGAVVNLSVSTSYPDTDTSFNTNYYYTLPANNKYIGIDFRDTNQIDAFVKTNTNYFWFAIVATTTP